MKKPIAPASYNGLAKTMVELAEHDRYRAELAKYEAYKAEKAKKNVAYRARRSAREQKAQQEAAALRANRDIDPTREEWLSRAALLLMAKMREIVHSPARTKDVADGNTFHPTGPVKVALGVPPRRTRKGETWGVCYHQAASEGGYREIFINPSLTDTRHILGVLTHELIHACFPDKTGHRAPFKRGCEAVGFTFEKCEYAVDGDAWWSWAKTIADELGTMPHKKLNTSMVSGGSKKQKARLLLLECPCCKIKVRTAKSTLAMILETSDAPIARCMNPACEGEIDFENLMRELDNEAGDEEE
jgi:hypothetical protein